MSKLLYEPSDQVIERANITEFSKYVEKKRMIAVRNYSDLYDYSVSNIPEFWEDVWEFTNIIFSKPYLQIVKNFDTFPPATQWFPEAHLNFAENLLRYDDNSTAILMITERDDSTHISYRQLRHRVARIAKSLRDMGITKNDRVAAYMPNIADTIIAMLAVTSIGATWSSCGAELGGAAALDRLGQVKPKVLFSVDAYIYKDVEYDMLEKIKEVVDGIDSIEQVVMIPYVNHEFDISKIRSSIKYQDFIADESTTEIKFEQVEFNHPLYIMFSSGTTGKPKCMVQSVGGVLINHLKELVLHTDLRKDDKLMYLSSPSWMMWNWMSTSLALGITLILYDGNPLNPNWRTIWRFVERFNISVLGCSASYLHHLLTIGAKPGEELDLSSLRQISQTGSALSTDGFEFVYRDIKADVHLNSISGGTDINGCFAAGSPTLPVYQGQIQARALGMRVFAYDDNTNPVYDEQGELVCESPSPSMPIYFWEDENNEKYDNAYFNYYPNKRVWRHGDYIQIDSKTGGVSFYGRSDSVLKPSGVRIGTAEIYNVVNPLAGVVDSLAIGQKWKRGQRILLFVQLEEGSALDDPLIEKIKSTLRTKASPRHVPRVIMQTPDIPYSFSGKKVESAVTNIIHGRKVTNRGALRNPESLDFYTNIVEELSTL